MSNCFVTELSQPACPIHVVTPKEYPEWLTRQSPIVKDWLKATQFLAEPNNSILIPDARPKLASVLCCVANRENLWEVGHLPFYLPEGIYSFDESNPFYGAYARGWGLGAYQFTRYKAPTRQPAQLYLPHSLPVAQIQSVVSAIYSVRDWINTPADDMGPSQFAMVAEELATQFNAQFRQIVGEDLLEQNYPCIYTVGKACDDPPRLIDMSWGHPDHPKVTLVGKGVCFDTGGLDLKPSNYMLLMKKDMAGGAHVLGLARMIIEANLPIRLRILIPVVENAVSGNAYRPGDIIKSRQGLTIEIGNTDAEGRVILADALAEAVSDEPEIIIDISTLTGAARVALGTELPAAFSNNDELAEAVIQEGLKVYDPLWRLPLFEGYKDYLYSQVADINNHSYEPYAGAITAALFLKAFVPDHIPWLHIDMMAWNLRSRPGRPQGGEAMTLRALFNYLSNRYGS